MEELLLSLRQALDRALAHVGLLHTDGTLLDVNRGPLHDAGFRWEDVAGRAFEDFPWWRGDPDARAMVRAAIDRAARGETSRFDIRIRDARGAPGWIDLQIAAVRNDDEQPHHLVWSAVDITDRRDVEFQLRDSEDRSRLARRASGLGVWDLDPRTGRIHWDDRLRELWGVGADEEVDFARFLQSVHLDDRSRVEWRAHAALQPGAHPEYRDEFRIVVAGATRWILALGEVTAGADGAPSRFVGTVQDVTDSRRAELALRESEERARLARRAANIGIWDYDPGSGALHWDARAYELWGILPGTELSYERFLAGIHADDQDRVAKLVDAALAPGSSGEYRAEFRRVVGEEVRWIAAIGDATFADGIATRLIGTIQDITAAKQTESKLREQAEELAAQDRRKDLFMATLGHEIRNPLAALDSGIRLVQAGAAPSDEILPMMADHVQQLSRLVNDLLEVSRITRGKVALRKEPADLAAVLRAATAAVDGSIAAKSQSLTVGAPDELPIDGDPTRLEQIFSNLLSNASKYTPVGGHIEVRCRTAGAEAVVEVSDTGCGLEADEIETIFEPFVQADPGVGGLGIGLALARALARLHGGELSAGSAGHQRGSTFTLRLPLGRSAATPQSPVGTAPVARRRYDGVRVLIVDDLHDSADLLALLLGAQGAETRCAYDGKGALRLAADFAPHIALLDLGLPDISGYEVAQSLRAEDCGRDMLLLAVTGFGDPGAARRAAEAGFDARLVKPVDHGVLHEHLGRFLDARTALD